MQAGNILLDAHLAYAFTAPGGQWEAFLDVSNLTDEEARPHKPATELLILPGRDVSPRRGRLPERNAMTARTQTWGDAAAIGLSALCMVHCLALPLLAASLPFIGLFAEAPWVHWAFAATAAPIAAWSLSRPMSDSRRNWQLLGLGGAGALLLFMAAAEWPTHAWETPVTVVGGLLLATAHGLNWRKHSHDH